MKSLLFSVGMAGMLLLPAINEASATEDDANVATLGDVTVTATREARRTADVPQAISVVNKEQLSEKKMFNVKEALQAMPGVLIDSKNGGFDARLIIRGAGLKAAYGIREIMVLRDGVPLSDPDSFTRLDFVDTQDIERIEVAKGPGNLFAAGSTGGAIQIFSKSAFDKSADNLKVGVGNEGTQNFHIRKSIASETQALALTATHRKQDNAWRTWNKFDTTQTSLKHGLLVGNGSLESEVSYAEANMQLPGAMDKTLFDQFVATGKQADTSEAWKNSGRYSKVLFMNSQYEVEQGDFTFKPRFYYNTWYHFHPVTGIINQSEKWVSNLGTDLEANWRHTDGTLVGGISIREERTPDSRKYQYQDVTTIAAGPQAGRITATLSDTKGPLAEVDDATNLLTGLYVQESWRPTDRWIVDMGIRNDVIRFKDDNNQTWKFDYATGKYVTGDGVTHSEKTYNLPAPKLAVSFKLNDHLNLFGMVAQAGQVPSQSEFSSNPSLEAPVSRNHEVGLKGRADSWQFDTSIYTNDVSKEIVQLNNAGVTSYVNAGETKRNGFEFSGSVGLGGNIDLGAYYSYTEYSYKSFTEPVRVGATTANVDRAGKVLPYVPKNQYGTSLGWKSGNGWKARLSANTWGSYWLDNANTEMYEGWKWVTNLSVGYELKAHSLTLNVDNLFDKHYAVEVKKDTAGKVTYSAATPRTTALTYRYAFD